VNKKASPDYTDEVLVLATSLREMIVTQSRMHKQTSQDKYIKYALLMIPSLLPVILLWADAVRMSSSTQMMVIWIGYFLIFLFNEALADSRGSTWSGLRILTLIILWALLGSLSTLTVIALGLLTARLIRAIWKQSGWRGAIKSTLYSSARIGAILLPIIAITVLTKIGVIDNPISVLYVSVLCVLGLVSSYGINILLDSKSDQPFWLRLSTDLLGTALTPILFSIAQFNEVWVTILSLLVLALLRGVLVQLWQVNRLLNRRNLELTLLRDIADELSHQPSLDITLQSIANRLMEAMRVEGIAFILGGEHEQSGLQYRYTWIDGEWLTPQRVVNQTSSLEAFIIQKGRTLRIAPAQKSRIRQLQLPMINQADFNSLLGVPLMAMEKPFGAILLLDRERTEGFSDDELRIAEMIGSQVGGAVSSTYLQGRNTRLSEQMSQVNTTIQKLRRLNVDDKQWKLMCEATVAVCNADRAAIYAVNVGTDGQQYLNLLYGYSLTEAHTALTVNYLMNGMIPQQARTVADVSRDLSDKTLQYLASVGEFNAVAEIPIIEDSTVTGLLAVYFKENHMFTAVEIDLLVLLSSEITNSSENARLLNSLRDYAQEAGQMLALSRASLTSFQPHEVAESAIQPLMRMVRADSAMIMVLHPLTDEIEIIRLLAAFPPNLSTPHEKSLMFFPEFQTSLRNDMAKHVLISRRNPELTPNLRRMMENNQQEVVLILPMMVNRSPIGLILIGFSQDRNLAERDWQFIETATNLLAAQVKNAQLYNATREALSRRLEQLDYLENIIQQISNALDIDTVFYSVLEATLRVTQADSAMLAQQLEGGQYRIIRQSTDGKTPQRYVETVSELQGALKEVFRSGEKLLSPAYGLPRQVHETPPIGAYPSMVAVPLVRENQVVGVLAAQSSLRNFFTSEQAQFLQNLAAHVAISIANATYISERQTQLETLTNLRKLSMRLHGNADKVSTAKEIIATALDLLGGESAAIYHYSRILKRTFLVASSWMVLSDNLSDNTFVPNDPPIDSIQEAIHTLDPHLDYHEENGIEETVLIIPLVRGEHIHDILTIWYEGQHELTAREQEMVSLLANQATGHMESAALYEQLRASSNRVRVILDSTHDGMVLLDRQSRIVDFNRSASYMLGVDLAQYRNAHIEKVPALLTPVLSEDETLTSEEAEMWSMVRSDKGAAQKKKARQRLELERTLENDVTLYIEQSVIPVMGGQDKSIGQLMVLRDISEEKELAQYRQDITFMLVHDLRSPLGSVIAGLKFAQDLSKDPADADVLPEIIDLAYSSSNRLLRLINTLLDVERQHMNLLMQEVNILEVLQSSRMELANAAREVAVEIIIKTDALMPNVWIDREKIERVVINLLDNAMDYSHSQIHLSARVRSGSRWVEVRVSDDGPGIPAEKRQAIFRKFEQVSDPKQHQRRGKHSGIGLTYCRMAVEAHGGQISIEDDCALGGACFAFTVPIYTEKLPQQLKVATSTFFEVRKP